MCQLTYVNFGFSNIITFLVYGYQLILNNNSPVTTGSTVILNATVVDDNGLCVKGSLEFKYEDDAFPIHKFGVSCETF